jgi:hypothetical protein
LSDVETSALLNEIQNLPVPSVSVVGCFPAFKNQILLFFNDRFFNFMHTLRQQSIENSLKNYETSVIKVCKSTIAHPKRVYISSFKNG